MCRESASGAVVCKRRIGEIREQGDRKDWWAAVRELRQNGDPIAWTLRVYAEAGEFVSNVFSA